MCFPMIPIPPPTERCRKVVKKLEILCLLELLLSIVSLYVSYDLFFYMLFSALILYLGYTQLDFCSMMYFIFFTIIQLFDLLLIFASVWGAEVSQQTMALVIILDVLLVVFNIIALVIGCEAYKEFKLVALEAERDLFGRGGFGFGGPGFGPGYGPSAGPRYRYGGVDPDGDIESRDGRVFAHSNQADQDNTQSNQRNQGNFQAFQGRAVVLT